MNHSPWLMPGLATEAEARAAAQHWANMFWFYAIVAGLVGWFFGWWALIPGAAAAWCVRCSVKGTLLADQCRREGR